MQINSFFITSSTEVQNNIQLIEQLDTNISLIHVASLIHDSVLVQNLKLALERTFPNAQIILLKHQDKTQTNVTVYSLHKDVENNLLSHEILNVLHVENTHLEKEFQESKTELLNKYFIDNLTQLPNIYKLRKNLENKKNYTLVTIAIDNFMTINNFYGSIVGDYVIEKISLYLQDKIESQIYRTSGTEFMFSTQDKLNFHPLKEYLASLYEEIKNISIDTK